MWLSLKQALKSLEGSPFKPAAEMAKHSSGVVGRSFSRRRCVIGELNLVTALLESYILVSVLMSSFLCVKTKLLPPLKSFTGDPVVVRLQCL